MSDATDIQQLAEAYRTRRIDRRTFLTRASLLGLSGTALASFLAACAGQPPATPTAVPKPAAPPTPAPKPAAAPTTAPAKPAGGQTRVIKSGASSQFGFTHLTMLAAFDLLEAKGYKHEPQFFPSVDASIKAIVSSTVELGQGTFLAGATAVEAGADLAIIADRTRLEYQLVTPVAIKTPQDLNGKKIAHHGPLTVTEAMVKLAITRAKINPQVLVIPGSEARATALMAGQIDATVAEIGDVLNLMSKEPGKFHVLMDYPVEFPELLSSVYFYRRSSTAKDAQFLQDFMEASIQVNRKLQESPDILVDAAKKHLKTMSEDAIKKSAEAYRKLKIYDVNMDISQARIKQSVDFYKEMGLLKQVTDPQKYFELSALNRALDKLGRR